jgi:UDP-N-acetylmuramoyl-tripeptide--D-alanyl-D-alanine ligase
MVKLTLAQLHQTLGGKLRVATLAPRLGEHTPVGRIVIDSRQVQPGDVFWGLPGSHVNGAEFAASAFTRGASGVVVGKKYVQPPPGCWSIQVEDAAQALVQLAAWNRRRFAGRTVAVTGSVGKTTTRQMIHAVLGHKFSGSASPQNYNNHIGLPLSMLAMKPDDTYAVLELAANRSGEIGELALLCRPDIAVITQVGDAHLGGFGSLDAVAKAKTELLTALPSDGLAVLAGDDVRLRRWAAGCKARKVWFGRSLDNDLVATNIESQAGRLTFEVDGTHMEVAVRGRHYLGSALAAVAVGRAFGLRDAEISRGLCEFEPPPMRCQITKVGGTTIIDDTYNASPLAMRAALELLRDFSAPGRRIVVCGDMRELGPEADSLHRDLGDQVVTLCGADLLLACGEHSREVVDGARSAGMSAARTWAAANIEELFDTCENLLQPGDVVLIKGSRAMAMQRLVEHLQHRKCEETQTAVVG